MKKFYLLSLCRNFFVILMMIATAGSLFGQASNYVSKVNTGTALEGEALSFMADLMQSSNVTGVRLFYKPFGESEFKEREMQLSGMLATVTIPGEEIKVPYLEYYLQVELRDGSLETFPIGIPDESAPLQISVGALSEKDKEILLLSPSRGEQLTLNELFISVSLVKAPDNVDNSATKIYLNNTDVTPLALFAGDLILFYAENFPGTLDIGTFLLKVDVYDKSGQLYHTINSDFNIVSKEFAEAMAQKFNYRFELEGESRNESFDEESTWYNNVSANFNGSYERWDFNGNAYITSEEKSYLQPQNRFSASVETDWLSLKAGDTYPRYPSLIMDGKRVRGFSGALKLGVFNVQTSIGETIRNLEGTLLNIISRDSISMLLQSNVIDIDSAKYGEPFGEVELGTYSRQLFAVRPSFGSGENFQLGFSYLHGKDDFNSIDFGATPEENLVLGSDFVLHLDDQRINFKGQAAFSLSNNDISTGNMTDEEIDSVFGVGSYIDIDPEDVKKIKDFLGNFITVNQFLGPLNPQEFASVAAEASVNLNYFNNSLTASYIYRGNDFESFGQSYLRTDIKGLNIIDRIRLFDNKVFVSLGYESLEDNLQGTKISTTEYKTLNTSVSIFPRANFPNVTLGFTRYENANGLDLATADSTTMQYVVDDMTNRFLIQLSYDFEAGIKHNSALSFMTSSREDNSFWDNDKSNTSISLSLNSYWSRDLTSNFSLVYNTSNLSYMTYDSVSIGYINTESEYNYLSLSVGGRYKILEDKLELSANFSPSFGDFKRNALDFVGQYFVTSNFSLLLQVRFYQIPDESTNSIVGLSTRVLL